MAPWTRSVANQHIAELRERAAAMRVELAFLEAEIREEEEQLDYADAPGHARVKGLGMVPPISGLDSATAAAAQGNVSEKIQLFENQQRPAPLNPNSCPGSTRKDDGGVHLKLGKDAELASTHESGYASTTEPEPESPRTPYLNTRVCHSAREPGRVTVPELLDDAKKVGSKLKLRKEQEAALRALLLRQEIIRERELLSKAETNKREIAMAKRWASAQAKLHDVSLAHMSEGKSLDKVFAVHDGALTAR
jgi:hypothetical protein